MKYQKGGSDNPSTLKKLYDLQRQRKINAMKEYKLKVGCPQIGDTEMEHLSPEEQEVRWKDHREAVAEWEKNGKKDAEQSILVEDDSLLDEIGGYPFESHSSVIWDTSKPANQKCLKCPNQNGCNHCKMYFYE